MEKRVLIVGTVPYNKNTPARAFDAYFRGWQKDNLAQIFSYSQTPVRGHAGHFYQITDKRLLQRLLGKPVRVERIWKDEDLKDEEIVHTEETGVYKKMYVWGSQKSPIKYLARRLLWRKSLWCTDTLNKWLDDFAPECVFLAFSDDFFIPQIALYVAERYNIPIVSSIGDDYYFNYKFSLSPFYHIYKLAYRKLIRRVFAHGGSANYISDKIRDKYNGEFGLDGETVYLSSEIERKPFSPINRDNPVISYFGNIRQGRNESLNEIGYALGEVNKDYCLNIYSGQTEQNTIGIFEQNPNVRFHGKVPYTKVMEETRRSDIVVIVEGFKDKHVNNTRYSLSTKAADSLASGAQILVYGSAECGVIEYMKSTDSAAVCTDRAQLADTIRHLIDDEAFQKQNYENAVKMTQLHHTLESSTKVFREIVEKAVKRYDSEHKL